MTRSAKTTSIAVISLERFNYRYFHCAALMALFFMILQIVNVPLGLAETSACPLGVALGQGNTDSPHPNTGRPVNGVVLGNIFFDEQKQSLCVTLTNVSNEIVVAYMLQHGDRRQVNGKSHPLYRQGMNAMDSRKTLQPGDSRIECLSPPVPKGTDVADSIANYFVEITGLVYSNNTTEGSDAKIKEALDCRRGMQDHATRSLAILRQFQGQYSSSSVPGTPQQRIASLRAALTGLASEIGTNEAPHYIRCRKAILDETVQFTTFLDSMAGTKPEGVLKAIDERLARLDSVARGFGTH